MRISSRHIVTASLAAALAVAALARGQDSRAELVGLASLPATTFEPPGVGHASGYFLDEPIGGVRRPRYPTQPIGNVSGLAPGGAPGEFLAIADNGYGTKAKSADFLLSVYRLRAAFRTEEGGDGSVAVELAFRLSDPDKHIPWPIVADAATYPNSDVPVPAEVREKRLLTGGDFSPESIARADDGTFWVGDDYGPFLLHFDAKGRLLRPPVETQIEISLGPLHSPHHPTMDAASGLVRPGGGGFAGLAIDEYGRPFVVMGLPLAGENEGQHVQIFDIAAQGRGVPWQEWSHHDWILPDALAGTQVCIGDLAATRRGKRVFLATVTGNGPGETGRTMYVLRFMFAYGPRSTADISRVRGQRPVIDLLDLADPHDLDRDGDQKRYRSKARDPAAMLIVDDRTVIIASDNGFPTFVGNAAEPTRLIVVRAPEPFVSAAAGR